MTTADHDYDAAAAQLGVSRWYLERHIKELPHQRYSRNLVRFTDEQIAAIRERFAYHPDVEPATVVETGELRPSTRRRAS